MKSAHFSERNPLDDNRRDHWSLSWKPDGHCDHFTKEAILAYAPAASGVYGLYNFDCQIFIGESANIREVLLRLEQDRDFQSRGLRPTGFSFELCPHDSRKREAAELIARYRPALQTMAGADDVRVAPRESIRSPGTEMPRRLTTHVNDHEFPSHADTAPKAYPRAKWSQLTLLSAILLAAGAAAYFYFAPFDFPQIGKRGGDKSSASLVRSPVSKARQKEKGSQRAEMAPKNNLGRGANADELPKPGPTDAAVRLVNAAGNDDSDRQKFLPSENASNRAEKTWSVQISAVPERDVADRIAQQLSARGYDSHVVQAEVKGHTYYRVRAGRFDAPEDADSLRRSLEESYRDAYVTTD